MDDNNLIRELINLTQNALTKPGGNQISLNIFESNNSELNELAKNIVKIINAQNITVETIEQISLGNIDNNLPVNEPIYNPIKNLQSKLKHLIWQTNRIKEGDYSQQIDFMGKFSSTFNQLIESLKERQELERKLIESQSRYELIANNTTDVIFFISLKTFTFNFVSPSILQQRGFTVKEAMNQTLEEALTPESYQKAIEKIGITINNINKNAYEPTASAIYTQPCKDGSIIEVEIRTKTLFDKNNNPTEILGISRDISKRQKAERKLKLSEEKYRLITENANDLICKVNLEKLIITYVSPSVKNILGYEPIEIIGENILDFISNTTKDQLKKRLNEILSTNDSKSNIRIQVKKWDSSLIYCELGIALLLKDSGEVHEIVGIMRDISQRVNIENALKKSQTRLKELLALQNQKHQQLSLQFQYVFNNSNNGIAFFTRKNNKYYFETCNEAWALHLNISANKLEGKEISTVCDEQTTKIYKLYLNKAIKSQSQIQEYVQWKNLHLHVILNPLQNHTTKKFDSCAVFIYNITEKEKAQQAANEYNERFFQIFNQSNDGILVLNYDFEPIEINNGFYNIFKSKQINKHQSFIDLFIAPSSIKLVKSKFLRLIKGDTIPAFECEMIDSHKNTVSLELGLSTLQLQNRKMILCFAHDLSARKEMERVVNNAIIQIENRERKKIANDLHDNVGPLLSSMNMYLSILTRKPYIEPHKELIGNTQHILKETIASVREISNNLNPQVLQRFGLTAALNTFFETKKELISINIDNNLGNHRFAEENEIMIYNIIKEVFNNSLKHAEATYISLSIKQRNGTISIKYTDNGIGFNLKQMLNESSGKLGLQSIINRINHINGNYKIITSQDKGFLLKLNFPEK